MDKECTAQAAMSSDEMAKRIQYVETENACLKRRNEQMEGELSALAEKLEDAFNEIARLTMVLRHRENSVQSERRLGRLNELLLMTRHHSL